ncbi:MAG: thioredoxin family protein [candidate division WOR-3 bacterium]
MALLSDAVRKQAQQMLAPMVSPVKLVVFSQEMECAHCRENRLVAEETATLSDKLSVEVVNFILEKEKVEQYKVERVPAICVVGEKDYGIRFYGVPAGFEFTSLLNAILLASKGDSGLKPETRAKLAAITQPVDLSVFVTLTCPYCPMQVAMAHRFAVESGHITAAAIDSAEFVPLAQLYSVMAVPKTVINRRHQVEGALPEEKFLEEVLKGLEPPAQG